jgi:hypothetical protein
MVGISGSGKIAHRLHSLSTDLERRLESHGTNE